MIRVSETVLPGHPDKFCDQVCDAIVQHCYQVDPQAYCQVEMSCWSDQVFLTGGIVTARPLRKTLEQIVRETGHELGYVAGNAIDAERYAIHSTVCQNIGVARQWTRHVNDQCISVGWAGYDEKLAWLPPEHFLVHVFREALVASFAGGRLHRQGPDGKLIVRLRENHDAWVLEHVLLTVQQLEDSCITEVCAAACTELGTAYETLRARDRRWVADWCDVELLVNPNGPLVNGGSDGDNGQTGRKLAVDYYGPRVPIGGGAMSGKDLSHIDRAAAYALRQAAIHAVQGGARECLVTGVWAPNQGEPLDIIWQLADRGPRLPNEWFAHQAMMERQEVSVVDRRLATGRHFYDSDLPWNR
ncbi:MAG: methionine adenosyltransferase domain-containing protein [Gammaproteobacteria bacterium]|jgi:S-adenosylmethionine synthetase|nr:methionine adenosyltransferase domain-containing protein [Gammaproteobacteria bacterium]MBK7521637.1 methionine adenosyltransferase domain-containing protein [Gammaproteobacteria bacterium]MBK8307555.1 methionine adenosyltransferase domain-containing protein [Gammaproteobacteria bacterium]MBK9668279.1 methionine adenosyltransferase domain-containing protein [Gammaproteobacteria bacterium]